MVRQAYRYALRPNAGQRRALARHVAFARRVFNWGLSYCKDRYASGEKHPTHFDLCKAYVRWRNEGGPLPGRDVGDSRWDSEARKLCRLDARCSSATYLGSLRNVSTAYKNFFRGLKASRRVGFPRFKGRRARKSFYLKGGIRAEGRSMRLPTFGSISTHEKTRPKGRIEAATISLESDGRWYVMLRVERDRQRPGPRLRGRVGVDLGISCFAVLSTGERIEHPRPYKEAERRLAQLSRVMSRRVRGSAGHRKAVKAVAKCHARVAAIRKDFLHTLTTRLAKEHSEVVVEDLSVWGLMRTKRRGLAKAVGDQGWGTFRIQLAYKTEWYGGRLVVADRFYPSTKRCSACGVVGPKVPLDVRVFKCAACGYTADRDLNAARNLEQYCESTATQAGFEAGGGDGKTVGGRAGARRRQPQGNRKRVVYAR